MKRGKEWIKEENKEEKIEKGKKRENISRKREIGWKEGKRGKGKGGNRKI